MRHTEYYSASVKQCSQKISFSISLRQCSCIIFTDEQWNNLKAILIDNRDWFTDDQWKTVFHLLNGNRLNDEQFGIFVDMLDTSTQKLVLLHAGGRTGKLLLCVKSLKSWPGKMEFVIAHVQPGSALCTYHKAEPSIVFSRHGHQVWVQVLQ